MEEWVGGKLVMSSSSSKVVLNSTKGEKELVTRLRVCSFTAKVTQGVVSDLFYFLSSVVIARHISSLIQHKF